MKSLKDLKDLESLADILFKEGWKARTEEIKKARAQYALSKEEGEELAELVRDRLKAAMLDERDQILFGEPYSEQNYAKRKFRRFIGLDREGLEKLVAIGAAKRATRQNAGPNIQQFEAFLEKPGTEAFRMAGYVGSGDCLGGLITLDTVYTDEEETDPDVIRGFLKRFKDRADVFDLDPPYAQFD